MLSLNINSQIILISAHLKIMFKCNSLHIFKFDGSITLLVTVGENVTQAII